MTGGGCKCKCKSGLLSQATSSTCPVTRVYFFTSDIYNGLAAGLPAYPAAPFLAAGLGDLPEEVPEEVHDKHQLVDLA